MTVPELPQEDGETPSGGRTAWGIWSNYANPLVMGSLGSARPDWLCIDEQHGYAPHDLEASVAAGQAGGAPVFLRVARNRPELIGRALDAGVAGVIVPMIQGPDDARGAVEAAHYPPAGSRSLGPARRAFGIEAGYLSAATPSGAEPACLVMIESARALDDLERIAAVPRLTGIFVGPFDLALALGTTADELIADPSSSAPLRRIVAACERHDLLPAAYAGTPERARRLAELGFRFIAATTDDALLRVGYAAVRDQLD